MNNWNTFIDDFIQACLPYYHISKRKYLERKLTYNTFKNTLYNEGKKLKKNIK